MIGLTLDILGAFFLAAEAIKLENFARIRERVLKPFNTTLKPNRIFYEADGSMRFERPTRLDAWGFAIWFIWHFLGGMILVGLALSLVKLLLGWDLLMTLWRARLGLVPWARWPVILFVGFQAALLTAAFPGEMMHKLAELASRLPIHFLSWINRKAPNGTIGVIGFALLFVGFIGQMVGTWLGGQPSAPHLTQASSAAPAHLLLGLSSFETVQVAVGLTQIGATALIAWVVYVQSERLKRSEISGRVQESYNLLNSVALSTSENLRAFDEIGRGGSADTDETRRKRWAAFLWLVALQETFISGRNRMIDGQYAEQSLRQQLVIILQDDLVFWLLLNRGFDPAFVELCRPIRQQVAPGKPTEYSEAEAISGLSQADPESAQPRPVRRAKRTGRNRAPQR
jgi:hypothetical protein